MAGTFFGPTCDGFDALFEKRMARLRAGDWLLFPEFGAYTSAAASGFNGLTPAVVRSMTAFHSCRRSVCVFACP